MEKEKIKILYIAGTGRSGSTLLGRMLGQISDFVTAGELHRLFGRKVTLFRLRYPPICGCGKFVDDCDFWTNVMHEALGGFENMSVERISQLKLSVDSARYIPQALCPWKTENYSEKLKKYIEVMGSLYQTILKISGSKIVVDTSQDPWMIFFLKQIPNIDLHVLHFVRDSRGVAFSWQRKKIVSVNPKKNMPVRPSWRSALEWVLFHLLAEAARILKVPYTLIRYEDLISDPAGTIAGIVGALGMDPKDLDFIGPGVVDFAIVNHVAIGNPGVQSQQGLVRLRLDDEWREKMGSRAYWVVTCITFPLLLRYGYDIRGRGDKWVRP